MRPRCDRSADHGSIPRVGQGLSLADRHRCPSGQTYSRTDSGVPGVGNDIVTTVTTVTDMTAYVDVTC